MKKYQAQMAGKIYPHFILFCFACIFFFFPFFFRIISTVRHFIYSCRDLFVLQPHQTQRNNPTKKKSFFFLRFGAKFWCNLYGFDLFDCKMCVFSNFYVLYLRFQQTVSGWFCIPALFLSVLLYQLSHPFHLSFSIRHALNYNAPKIL